MTPRNRLKSSSKPLSEPQVFRFIYMLYSSQERSIHPNHITNIVSLTPQAWISHRYQTSAHQLLYASSVAFGRTVNQLSSVYIMNSTHIPLCTSSVSPGHNGTAVRRTSVLICNYDTATLTVNQYCNFARCFSFFFSDVQVISTQHNLEVLKSSTEEVLSMKHGQQMHNVFNI